MEQCLGCGGRLGWYSDDNGQWVSCLNCQAGRARHEKEQKTIQETSLICQRKLTELQEQLLRP
jgi:hypothetical protein